MNYVPFILPDDIMAKKSGRKIIVTKSKNIQDDNLKHTSKKDKIKLILRILTMLLSSTGFLYQISQLLAIYLSGETKVDNRVESLVYSELPALTICLPTFVSMERFAENVLKISSIPERRQLYEEYRQFRDQFKEWDHHANTTHTNLFEKFTRDFLKINISIIDIFDKVSLPELNMTNFYVLVINKNGSVEELAQPLPVRSLVPFSDPRECFTYFSEFDSNYKYGNKFKLIKLEMKFQHNEHDFPISEYYTGDFHIAVHSANYLPKYVREETFMALKMREMNVISFHEIRTRLLEPPFDTSCKWYDLTQTKNNMRSDCVRKCIDQELIQLDPTTNCIFTAQNFKLVRRENLDNFGYLELCDYPNYTQEHQKEVIRLLIELEHRCQGDCPSNCREKFYEFSIEVIKVHANIKYDNEFGVLVMHDRFPDQLVEHKPIMSWIELMSNFGGLLGMWLGLSVAFLFEYAISLL